jgi:phage tail-like protein
VDAPYLNLDLDGAGVRQLLDGVVVQDGTIRLASVQAEPETLGDELEAWDALEGVAGIGVAPNGDVYVADPARNQVLRVAACGGAAEPVGCLHQLLREPHGVLVGPRDALYVADTGNNRVLVVDLATEQLRATWGQLDPYGRPAAGSNPGELDSPWDLTADAAGRVYVVDYGNRRLQRFDPDGRVDPGFADQLAAAATVPTRPEYVVTALFDDQERLLVFDRVGPQQSRILVYDVDGSYQAAAAQDLRRLLALATDDLFSAEPAPLAAAGPILQVAETATGRVLEFDLRGRFVGVARWQGTARGLALDAAGRLLVNQGTGQAVRLNASRTAAAGSFRIGPFAVGARDAKTVWQTLHASIDPLPAGAHVRLLAMSTGNRGAIPPALDKPAWHAAPVDATSWLTGVHPGRYLWLGGRLTSGEADGPVVRSFRIGYDRDGWLRYLPAIYARESSEFLEPALAMLEDALDEQEAHLDALPRLFDPQATPAAALPWLAGWLAWELEETLSEQAQRALVGRAFELQGRRGTAASLRDLIRVVLDVDARIFEPASSLRLWQLGEETAGLGWGTMLAAAEPDGAVLGTTAEIDHSHLLPEEDYGAPVFDATAQRFCVQVYAAKLDGPEARATLGRLVDRERPAGTEAHICIVEPQMRVGFQATLGVDTIVGREQQPFRLGLEGRLGAGAALADSPSPQPAVGIRLGRTNPRERGAR